MKYLISIILFLICPLQVFSQQSQCISAIEAVNTDTLIRFVKELSGETPVIINQVPTTIQSRFAAHTDNEKAYLYLKAKCQELQFTTSDFVFSATGKNLLAQKTGTLYPDKAILLGAHYDNVGNSISPFRGADDNASGVAALLEAARVLKNISFPYTIVLAFWDEEESGLLGSKAFAPTGNGTPEIIAALNLDMIAWDGDNDSLVMLHAYPLLPQTLWITDRIKDVNRKYAFPLKPFVKSPGELATDHYSFWNTGLPAAGITEDYDIDFNPHWHQWSDSLFYFNIPYFTAVSRLAIATLCEMVMDGKLTGIADAKGDETISYSNPVHSYCHIRSNKNTELKILSLYTLTGKTAFKTELTGHEADVLIGGLIPAGLYLAELETNRGRHFIKLIIE